MRSIKYSFSTLLVLSLASALLGCSSDASPAASQGGADPGGASNEAGADSGGAASRAGSSAGGASAGDDNAAGANDAGADNGGTSSAGANAAGASAAGAPNVSTSPCNYTVSGVSPVGDLKYLCTASSRLWQQKGKGDFDLLFGGGFYTDSKHVSTLACSLKSKVAPAAGDVWVLGDDHPGNCEVDYSEGATANAWKSNSAPAAMGSASIKFLSATLTPSTKSPEDVYYTFELELTATLPGVTGVSPETPAATVSGTFRFPSLPLGY